MKKILSIFGTRPEAIKMAPLVKELSNNETLISKVCVTAQHREMLDQVLNLFEIVPDYDLNIMRPKQSLSSITAKILLALEPILEEYKPDILLVHGDTTTTLSAAIAAYYQKISIGHIEAGLRTNNIYSPWPEEGNRSLTGSITSFHFTPTTKSANNLRKENIHSDKIYVTGNTVIDALLTIVNKIKNTPSLQKTIENSITQSGYSTLRLAEKKMILITGHRRESFGQGFIEICKGIQTIAKNNPNIDIVYPVHMNPNVRVPVGKYLDNIDNIFLIEPQQYQEFVFLMSKSYFIITDSGGIQEEAPSLGKPVLVMRDTTERPEAVEAGTVKLVGTNADKIIIEAQILLDDTIKYKEMSHAHNPYGDGNACKRIVKTLIEG